MFVIPEDHDGVCRESSWTLLSLSAQSFVVSPLRDVETRGSCALRGTKHSFALLRSHVSLAQCLVRAAFVTGRHSAAQHSVLCPCASSQCFLSILGVLRLVSDSLTIVRLWKISVDIIDTLVIAVITY